MSINHLRLAWRTLSKRKGYSALNILGLAIQAAKAALANPINSLKSE